MKTEWPRQNRRTDPCV